MPVNQLIQVRRGTAAAWTGSIVLSAGEFGYETDTGKTKIGDGATIWSSLAYIGGGTGTVTTASVVSANGLSGTVANPTTTPAITLSTTITGVVKGNGTAISAAVAGTDFVIPGGALGTPSSGTLTNATGLPVAGGGTGVATLTGLVKGNGTSAFTVAVVGTDYLGPTSTINGGTP